MALMSCNSAWASHVRSTDLRWSVPDPADPLNVVVEMTVVARSGFYALPTNPAAPWDAAISWRENGGGGATGALPVRLQEIGTGVDAMTGTAGYEGDYRVFRGAKMYRFPATGVYTLDWSHCCRVSNLANGNHDQNMKVQSVLDLTGSQRGGPVMAVPPIINLTAGALNTLSFPMMDPDGDPITCRFAQSAEAGGLPVPVPVQGGRTMTLTSSGNVCTLTWDLRGVAGESFHALPMVLESTHSGQRSSAAFDRYVIVTNRAFPICTGGGQVALQPNQIFRTRFEATASSGLSFSALGIPASASVTPPSGSMSTSPMVVDVVWSPTAADAGSSFIMQGVFRDAANVEGYCNYVVNVDTRNAALQLAPLADVLVGAPVSAAGTTSNVNAGEPVEVIVTANGVAPTTLSTTVAADGSWQVSLGNALPAGPVAVQARLRNFNVVPADGSFKVVQAGLTLNPVNGVLAGVAPQLSGTSTPALSGTVEVVFTDAAGVTRTLQTPLVAGVWSLTGPVNLALGNVTVRASVVGMPAVTPAVGQFAVAAVPVPVNAGWALGLLAGLLGVTGWCARRSFVRR